MSIHPMARVADLDACPRDGHGSNVATAGDASMLVNGRPALRVGDATACGDRVTSGMSSILVGDHPVAHLGSGTAHGGVIASGSGDVLVGSCGRGIGHPRCHNARFRAVDPETGRPVADLPYTISMRDGTEVRGTTDADGLTQEITTREPEVLGLRWAASPDATPGSREHEREEC